MSEITHNQVTKVSVQLSQKILTGQYETRDYMCALEISKTPDQTVEEVMEYGRNILSQEVGSYYERVKKAIAEKNAMGE